MNDSREHHTTGLPAYLAEQDWNELRSSGNRCAFETGAQLLRQGDEGEFAYVILSGVVKVVRSEPTGERTILTLRGTGDVVGDWSVLDGARRSASVSALTPVICQAITGPVFRRFIARPAVAAAYHRYNLFRLREADTQRTELAVLPVRQRLARALLRLHQATSQDSPHHGVELPQQDLAELVGASRNAVVLALGVLRANGVIVTRRRRVTIRDIEALHAIAEQCNHLV